MKTLKTTLDILGCFTSGTFECSVSGIARKLGIHKSTVSRVLSTLASGNVLVKSPIGKKYRLGSKVLEWASIYLSATNLKTVVLPHMKELASKTNETVSLFVREGTYRICLERVEGSHDIRMVGMLGDRLPLHAGAPGKLLLAYLQEDERNELLEATGLPRFTPHTITSREELEKEFKRILEQGFAVSFQERVPFAATVCAPIRNHTGEVVAALSVQGPVMRFSPKEVAEYSVLVRDVTNKVSQELGFNAR